MQPGGHRGVDLVLVDEQHLLTVGLDNGFELRVGTTLTKGFLSRVESHHCYYALEGDPSYCVFTLRFDGPPSPLPEPSGALAFGVVLLVHRVLRKAGRG